MRKGFTLTLTALVTAFLVTSAVALGPIVANVPDVYIGPAAAGVPAETGVNTFRYSDALTLWDYVTPGVTTGDGSDSDTLYQAWAVKNATLSGGTGSYLAGSSVHYSIIQKNDVNGLLLSPTIEVDVTGWAAEINNAFNAAGAGLPDYALDQAGALTFRNTFFSPFPEAATYPVPVPVAGMPSGVLDIQEATLYVSDTNTTPGADKVLLVTLASGADVLSGGLVWETFADYSNNTTNFQPYKLSGLDTSTPAVPDPSAVVLTKTATSVSVQTPVTNSPTSDWWYYGQWQQALGSVTTDRLYQISASITGPGAANPTITLGLNSRFDAGYGFTDIMANGPTATASTWSAYMVPLKAGTPQAEVLVLDFANAGGLVTANEIKVSSVLFQEVKDSATQTVPTISSFTVASDGNASASAWGYYDTPLTAAGVTSPVFARTPANGATGAALSMTATTNTDPLNVGFASFQGPTASIPTTVDSLVLVRCRMQTSSLTTAKLPSVWLNVEAASIQPGVYVDRVDAATTGPSSTPKDYYMVFQAKDAVAQFNLRILADLTSINGNIQLTQLEVLEADMPVMP